MTYIACLFDCKRAAEQAALQISPFCFCIDTGQYKTRHTEYSGTSGPPSLYHTHTAETMQGPSLAMTHTEYYAVSQQEQSNPVQCIHQQCTFIYLMAESKKALKEILANFSLGVVSHLFVGSQQPPQW